MYVFNHRQIQVAIIAATVKKKKKKIIALATWGHRNKL